jgi:hypothetical protein
MAMGMVKRFGVRFTLHFVVHVAAFTQLRVHFQKCRFVCNQGLSFLSAVFVMSLEGHSSMRRVPYTAALEHAPTRLLHRTYKPLLFAVPPCRQNEDARKRQNLVRCGCTLLPTRHREGKHVGNASRRRCGVITPDRSARDAYVEPLSLCIRSLPC